MLLTFSVKQPEWRFELFNKMKQTEIFYFDIRVNIPCCVSLRFYTNSEEEEEESKEKLISSSRSRARMSTCVVLCGAAQCACSEQRGGDWGGRSRLCPAHLHRATGSTPGRSTRKTSHVYFQDITQAIFLFVFFFLWTISKQSCKLNVQVWKTESATI